MTWGEEGFERTAFYTPPKLDEIARSKVVRTMLAEREEKARLEAVVIGEKKRTAHSFGMQDAMELPAQPIERYESVTASVLRSREDISTLTQLRGKSKTRWVELFGDC